MRDPYPAERQFGQTVGGILAAIGGWILFRHGDTLDSRTLLGGGVVLVVAGVLLPRALRWPNRWWMRLAEALSFVGTRVVLGLVFFGVMTPIGIIKRMTGWDPLGRRRPEQPTYWTPYPDRHRDPKHLEKMF